MAKTTAMRLVELMVLKEDINRVIEFLGKKGNFQFQSGLNESALNNTTERESIESRTFQSLQDARSYLNIPDMDDFAEEMALPTKSDFDDARKFIDSVAELKKKRA